MAEAGAKRWTLAEIEALPYDEGTRYEIVDGALRCRRCGHDLGASAVVRHAPLAAAGPWTALRWKGDSPNFRLEETACAGCGTLVAVREVPTPDGAAKDFCDRRQQS